jgi:hypothetical protein
MGEARVVFMSFGALKDAFNKTNALCAAMEPNVVAARARLSQRRDIAMSMTVPDYQ